MNTNIDFIEFTDLLPLEEQNKIEKLLTHPSFPWALTLDSVYGANADNRIVGAVGFFHNFWYAGQQRSQDLPIVKPIIKALEEKANFRIDRMDRIRVGLFTQHFDDRPHGPHTDCTYPHYTAVYYVNECDGDFILYNETYEDYTEEEVVKAKLTIKNRVPPAKGKLVLFDGKHYHASSYPTKNPLRIAVTFNFTIESNK